MLVYALGQKALPFFSIRPKPINLTGTVHNDEVFPLYGNNPYEPDEPAIHFSPINVRCSEDARRDAARSVHGMGATGCAGLQFGGVGCCA